MSLPALMVHKELYRAIRELQNKHPNGDFNHGNLKAVFPKFHQYVDFGMKRQKALSLVYANIPRAYRMELHLPATQTTYLCIGH